MKRLVCRVVAGLSIVCGCDGGDGGTTVANLPYAANLTTLIGGAASSGDRTKRSREVGTPDDDACIEEAAQTCVKPQEECGDNGTSDVILDPSGAPIAVLCYPVGGVSITEIDGDLGDVGNNTIWVLDDLDDGPDVTGDVTIDGNNVTLYGHSPATSLIAGNLHIDKNNARVRGVHVQGDVIIDKNNPSIIDCVIEGDLIIHGNNVAAALCDVWGQVTIDGNNAVLVENRFAEVPVVSGNNTVCADNVAFEDTNGDRELSDDELNDLVECADKKR